MNRRLWTGVVAGVLAVAVLLTVGVGAYRAGQDDEEVTRVVTEGEPGQAEIVRVVGDRDWHGPGFGFFLIPLLVIVLIVLLVRGRGWGRWQRPYPHGYWHGGPDDPGHRSAWFDEWHRQAHEEERSAESGEASGSPEGPPPGTAPPVTGSA